jgi:CheY-like chemotaxis protein/HPt (histidine-containing phosphotransfer) domain-containing protein/two-component sensor histidine kinase
VLDFSRLEAGKYVMRLDDLEVGQMVQEVAELLAPKAHAKGIELVQRVDADVPFSIRGDVDRLKQVITNLVGNAIKFTERGHVLIHVTSEPADAGQVRLRFAVKDTGIGVSAEDQAKLFGAFSQVDGSLTRRYGGTGLGLAISKRLVEAQGGEIGVESAAGAGSTFWFSITTHRGMLEPQTAELMPRNARVLLVVQDDAQRDVIAELLSQWGMRVSGSNNPDHACSLILSAEHDRYDAAVIEATNERDDAAERLLDLCMGEALPLIQLTSAGQVAPVSSPLIPQVFVPKPVRASELYNGLISLLDGKPLVEKIRSHDPGPGDQMARRNEIVLVVDDNEINRLVAVDLLNELGYRSETVCDGQEALEKAGTGTYAAILMDCQMPRMDGYEATRRIRELPAPNSRVPIIALTAHALVGDRDRVLTAGMDDYITKPVRVKALGRVLRSWVEQRQKADVAIVIEPNEPAEVDTNQPVLDPTIPRRRRIVEMFLQMCPDGLAEVQDAAARRDTDALTKSAHKLKGSCLSLGAMAMAEACKGVEVAARGGQIDRDNLARLPSLMQSACHALRREMTIDSPSVPAEGA